MKSVLGFIAVIGLAGSAASAWAQGRGPRPPAPPAIVAVRAGQLFDAKAGVMRANQVVVITGDRITDVGPASQVQIPADAKVIDLSRAYVLPGLVDQHLHVLESAGAFPNGERTPRVPTHGLPETFDALENYMGWTLSGAVDAMKDLNAGFTSVVDMGALGGAYSTVILRDNINKGFIQGPRMRTAGPMLNEIDPDIKTPEAARAAVDELAAHHCDWVKIASTGQFTVKSDGTMDIKPSNLTLDLTKAVVDEAHKHGMKVACHAYGGEGWRNCVEGGVDAPQHGIYLTDADIAELVKMNVPLNATILEIRVADKTETEKFGSSRLKIEEVTWKKALKAGVTLGFSSGAQTERTGFAHGSQGEAFAYMVRWGMPAARALQTAMVVNSKILDWPDVGSVEKGKYGDLIALSANPLDDITEMQRVKFVMKGGAVVRNDLK